MLVQLVSTCDYLYMTSVLIKSIKHHGSTVDISILVTDLAINEKDKIRSFFPKEIEILTVDELGFDFTDQIREYYSVLEFNAACKILVLHYQIVKKSQKEVLFLDSDMLVMRNLNEIFSDYKEGIHLTPHILSQIPKDGLLPDEIEIIMAGHINAGLIFIKQSENTQKVLNWLVDKTKFCWFISPKHGMHAEQQWLSLALYCWQDVCNIILDKTINVGYWNLHERKLYKNNQNIMVNDRPASIFHFSGFRIPSNGKLTTYCDRKFDKQTETVISELAIEYEKRLTQEKNIFSGIKGDIQFNKRPLRSRMMIAQKNRNLNYYIYHDEPGFFEKIGQMLDKYCNFQKDQ